MKTISDNILIDSEKLDYIDCCGIFGEEIIQKHISKVDLTKPIEREQDKYYLNIFENFTVLNNAVLDLRHSLVYIGIPEPPDYFNRNFVSDTSYFRYHSENFLIRCVSLLDLTAHFINHSLKIGLTDRTCKIEMIIENENLAKSNLLESLKQLKNRLNELRGDRNKIIHKGDFSSDEINDIQKADIFLFWKQTGDFAEQLKSQKEGARAKLILDYGELMEELKDIIGQIVVQSIPYIKERIGIYSHLEQNKNE